MTPPASPSSTLSLARGYLTTPLSKKGGGENLIASALSNDFQFYLAVLAILRRLYHAVTIEIGHDRDLALVVKIGILHRLNAPLPERRHTA